MRMALLLLLWAGAGLAAPAEKADPRLPIDAAREGDAVIFTVRLAPGATDLHVEVYGTDGLAVAVTPIDVTSVRATFSAPPPGASVVARATARFPDGPAEGLMSVRVGPKPAPTGRATTVGGRRGRLRPPGG